MRFNDAIYIAPGYTKEQFTKLNLSLNSDQDQWKEAVDIFRARIENRFFQKIDLLLKEETEDAFAAMALNCLLVETLAQFLDGSQDYEGCSKRKYSEFLCRELEMEERIAKKFYDCVRCGILHSAQTKKKVCLSFEGQDEIFYLNRFLYVNVKKFTEKLNEYYLRYCLELLDGNKEKIRHNFIRKMKFICDR